MAGLKTRSPLLLVAAAVILFAGFAILWAAAPEGGHGVILLAGAVICAAVYVGLYLLQRSRHW